MNAELRLLLLLVAIFANETISLTILCMCDIIANSLTYFGSPTHTHTPLQSHRGTAENILLEF